MNPQTPDVKKNAPLFKIWTIARYEAKVLSRSWAFRIFSVVAIGVVMFMTIGITTKIGRTPHFMHALASSVPTLVIKMLAVYQGVIAIFLASDWLKRDRIHDTTQVVYVRSMSNAQYVIGKVGGLMLVYGILNIVGLGIAVIIHAAFSLAPFALMPYIYYSLAITIPTVVFAIGATFLAMNILRSQALVFVIGLAVSMVSLIVLGQYVFNVLDFFGFHTPIVYSEIIGFGNTDEILKLRGAYFLMGTGFILLSSLFVRRLRQSKMLNILAGVSGAGILTAGILIGLFYLNGKYDDRGYRDMLTQKSQRAAPEPAASMTRCDIEVALNGDEFTAASKLTIENRTGQSLDSILLTLNPGLNISSAGFDSRECTYSRDEHLVWLHPSSPFEAGDTASVELEYGGSIDERACYLDISRKRLEENFSIWILRIPKMYAFVSSDYLLLTAETNWYPTPGVPGGPAYPQTGDFHFADYRLTVDTPRDMVPVSQGDVTVDTLNSGLRHVFESSVNLPQVSLAIGNYAEKSIVVDNVEYSLKTIVGQDYVEAHLDSVADTIPSLIRSLKDEYEIQTGLTYPYERLSLVEVPIQFHTYRRFWTAAQEVVQPEIILIPEMGMLSAGADFEMQRRFAERRQERANQAESSIETQSQYFSAFVRTELLGTARSAFGVRSEQDFDADFSILPNYVTNTTRITSTEWPVAGTALELFIQSKIAPQERSGFWFDSGLLPEEEVNMMLQKRPLVDLLDDLHEHNLIKSLLETKSEHLFTLFGAYVGQDTLHTRLEEFLDSHRYQQVEIRNLLGAISPDDSSHLTSIVENWYRGTNMPGFIISDVESFDLVEDQRTVSQVKMTIANPEDVDGVVTLNARVRQGRGGFAFRFGGGGRPEGAATPWWSQGMSGESFVRTILVPAKTEMEVGFVLSDPPARVSINTHISRNLPVVLQKDFRSSDKKSHGTPMDTIVTAEYTPRVSDYEFIVDNEDQGFAIVDEPEPNMLRKLLMSLFSGGKDDQKYSEFRFWSPPATWETTAREEFYGRFIHSGLYKRSGKGENVVAWRAVLDEADDYDVYFYNGELEMPRWWRRRSDIPEDKGSRTFLVHYEDGVDEVRFDMNVANEGWNLIGTYRFTAGMNEVHLTDETDTRMVTADAIKWLRR